MKENKAPKGHIFGLSVKFYIYLFIFLVIAFIANSLIAKQSTLVNRPLKHFIVTGNITSQNKLAIKSYLITSYSGNLFNTLENTLPLSLQKKYIYVDKVSLTGRWPDTAIVNVITYDPVAYYNYNKLILKPTPHFVKNEYLASSGVIFTNSNIKRSKNLPYISAPAAYTGKMLYIMWNDLTTTLLPFGLEVNSLTINDAGVWVVKLTNGIILQLDTTNYIGELQRFSRIYPNITPPRGTKIYYIDLSYNNGASVRFN